MQQPRLHYAGFWIRMRACTKPRGTVAPRLSLPAPGREAGNAARSRMAWQAHETMDARRVARPDAAMSADYKTAAPELLELTVPAELAGLRLDQALARLLPQHSRNRIAAWMRAGD